MDGVTWSMRQPTDWLASNGRWYPASKYPRGWMTSALPPAPGQGGVGSILRRFAEKAGIDDGGTRVANGALPLDADGFEYLEDDWDTPAAAAPRPSPPPKTRVAPEAGFSVAKSGRSVANATVTDQTDYAHKVGPGAPPPPQIESKTPPAPGRSANTPAVRPAPAPTNSKANLEVIAGDLGKVLGGAKKRIEKAINDNFESGT